MVPQVPHRPRGHRPRLLSPAGQRQKLGKDIVPITQAVPAGGRRGSPLCGVPASPLSLITHRGRGHATPAPPPAAPWPVKTRSQIRSPRKVGNQQPTPGIKNHATHHLRIDTPSPQRNPHGNRPSLRAPPPSREWRDGAGGPRLSDPGPGHQGAEGPSRFQPQGSRSSEAAGRATGLRSWTCSEGLGAGAGCWLEDGHQLRGAFHGTAGARLTTPFAQRKGSPEPSVVPRRWASPTWRGGALVA